MVSILLLLSMITGLLPIQAFGAGTSASFSGSNDGKSSASTSSYYSWIADEYKGLRFSVVDNDGNIVATKYDTVDVIWGNVPSGAEEWYENKFTGLGNTPPDRNIQFKNTYIDERVANAMQYDNPDLFEAWNGNLPWIPASITNVGSTVKNNGDEIKKWFLTANELSNSDGLSLEDVKSSTIDQTTGQLDTIFNSSGVGGTRTSNETLPEALNNIKKDSPIFNDMNNAELSEKLQAVYNQAIFDTKKDNAYQIWVAYGVSILDNGEFLLDEDRCPKNSNSVLIINLNDIVNTAKAAFNESVRGGIDNALGEVYMGTMHSNTYLCLKSKLIEALEKLKKIGRLDLDSSISDIRNFIDSLNSILGEFKSLSSPIGQVSDYQDGVDSDGLSSFNDTQKRMINMMTDMTHHLAANLLSAVNGGSSESVISEIEASIYSKMGWGSLNKPDYQAIVDTYINKVYNNKDPDDVGRGALEAVMYDIIDVLDANGIIQNVIDKHGTSGKLAWDIDELVDGKINTSIGFVKYFLNIKDGGSYVFEMNHLDGNKAQYAEFMEKAYGAGWDTSHDTPANRFQYYGYKLVIEPILFWVPKNLKYSSGSPTGVNWTYGQYWYGTITNWIRFVGSEFGSEYRDENTMVGPTNVAAMSLWLNTDDMDKLKASGFNTNIMTQATKKLKKNGTYTVKNTFYGDPDLSYGLNVIWAGIAPETPDDQTQTDDPLVVPDLGPAPNWEPPPDEIWFTENPDGGDPIPFCETDYIIVKYYEHILEKLDGTIEKTYPYDVQGSRPDPYPYVRIENPHKIAIHDEEDWKVVGWFTTTRGEYDGNLPLNSKVFLYEEWRDTASKIYDSGSSEYLKTMEEIEENKGEKVLVVKLQLKEKEPAPPPPKVGLINAITESQINKVVGTDESIYGANFGNYTFQCELPPHTEFDHEFTLHVGCTHSCSDKNCSHSCGGHCGDYATTCSDVTRLRGDYIISATFGILATDRNETFKYTGASGEFKGVLHGKSGSIGDTLFWKKEVGDSGETWVMNSNPNNELGIRYLTTVWRGGPDFNDFVTLAKYKQSAMVPAAYSLVNTIAKYQNTPAQDRADNGRKYGSMKFKIGHTDVDKETMATCSGCGCVTHHSTKSITYTNTYDKTELSINGALICDIYAGLKDKLANKTVTPSPMTGFVVDYPDGQTTDTYLAAKQQSTKIDFYTYLRMSFQKTMDGIGSWPGYTSMERCVYVLSDKKSTIIPTDSAEISWYNKTQADGKFGLQMTSAQWATHSKAVDGSANWKVKNTVLPGGALFTLSTIDTESWVKSITYNTLVEEKSRQWITLSDPSDYTSSSIITETGDYLNQLRKSLEGFRLEQFVSTAVTDTNAWDSRDAGKTVEITNGGEPLDNLGLSGRTASTDSKYRLVAATAGSTKGSSEGDIDILRENHTTTVYKGFTDVQGDVYIAQLTVNLGIKQLDLTTLDNMVKFLEPVCGTNKLNAIPGLPSNMTYVLNKIGAKGDNTEKIIETNIKNNSSLKHLYSLDAKTKFITNLIDSVERNTGDDTFNATWMNVNDGKWYNESFDGIYMVSQTVMFKVGLGIPSKRVSVLDPNLCPPKSSTSNLYTNAFLSQFRLDSWSTGYEGWATAEAGKKASDYFGVAGKEGYVGTFSGVDIFLPNVENMYYCRPFYIPNANVQDLS